VTKLDPVLDNRVRRGRRREKTTGLTCPAGGSAGVRSDRPGARYRANAIPRREVVSARSAEADATLRLDTLTAMRNTAIGQLHLDVPELQCPLCEHAPARGNRQAQLQYNPASRAR